MRLHIGNGKASARPWEGFIPNPKLKLLDQLSEVMRFKQRLPVVLTQAEVETVLACMSGTHQLMAKLLTINNL